MRFTFEEVSLKATYRWADEDGKRRQKTKRFMQTLNPFNKNADGTLKTRSQIMAELSAQRDSWLRDCNQEATGHEQ